MRDDGVVLENRGVRVEQEIAFTTGGLIRLALIALIAFAALAWLLDKEFRPAAYIIGASVIGVIGLLLIFLLWQRRYGPSILIADGRFDPGRPFAGTIVTALREPPRSPLRILIRGWSSRSETTLARTTVDPMQLQRTADGLLAIRFHVPAADEPLRSKPREVRLRARTTRWPVGWGATFVIGRNG